MTDLHEQLRDRMPEVARGDAAWSAAEAGHLAACDDCRREWALVGDALRIGAGVERRFDAAATAVVVARRLRNTPVVVAPRYRPLFLLGAAAALALFVARPAPLPTPAPAVAEAGFLPELDSLTVEELTLLADAFDAPLAETPLIDGSPTAELDTIQLQRVLHSLEG
jgi:hypothetical protein